MNQLQKVKKLFEEDKRGYIFMSELKKASNSGMLISNIAFQYKYVPIYSYKNSSRIIAYQYHTLPKDLLTGE